MLKSHGINRQEFTVNYNATAPTMTINAKAPTMTVTTIDHCHPKHEEAYKTIGKLGADDLLSLSAAFSSCADLMKYNTDQTIGWNDAQNVQRFFHIAQDRKFAKLFEKMAIVKAKKAI